MRALHSLPAFLQAPVATVSAVAMIAVAACAPPAVSDSAPVAAMGGVGPEASGVSGLHAFVDVTVIPMDRERVLERQTVVVGEGRIINIGPSTSVMVPEGATRIDGRGRFLIPGLAEMHAHIPGPQNAEWAEDVLTLYVAAGVTFARGMLGHPTHLELRERAAAGELLAPTIFTSGPSINGNSAPDVETVERMVREQKAAGYDFLKVHPGPSRAVYDRMVAVAREVGIEFAGHVPADVGLQRALEARQETVDHLDGYMELLLSPGSSVDGPTGFFGMALTDRVDPARIPAVARATREAGVWNVPTQSLIENLASEVPAERMAEQPAMRYVPRAIVDGWIQAKRNFQGAETFDAASAARFVELRHRLIRGLHEAGAGLLLGSDAPQIFNVPGFAIHPELRMMVDAGLTPYQALETGTRNPAVFLGQESEFGTIERGRRADLVLLAANPLDDITATERIEGVMVRGRWLPAREIAERLERIAARSGR
jgi:imidazolonepropionase-like amidohydrolase